MMQFVTSETVRVALTRVFSLLDARFELPREELERRPDYPDAWTIAEHLEHVCLANHFLLLTIKKGCRTALRRAAGAQPPEGESDLALLSPIASPGAFDWSVPSHMVPTGRRQPAEIRDELNSQRDACLELLAGMPRGEGRLCSIRISVHALGRLDMYQWLYFLAQHARYHLALITLRRALYGYP
jgi:hypothetical protein